MMIVYMSDTRMTGRPSPAYCAGDCMFTASRLRKESEVAGIPTASGRSCRNHKCRRFLIAYMVDLLVCRIRLVGGASVR